jgi:hypothetical protein
MKFNSLTEKIEHLIDIKLAKEKLNDLDPEVSDFLE